MHAIVFDVDNTLTPPRREADPQIIAALMALRMPFHLAAGSDLRLVTDQILAPLQRYGFQGVFDAFVSNGAQRCRCHFAAGLRVESISALKLSEHLGAAHFQSVLHVLQQVIDEPQFVLPGSELRVVGPRIIDRGGMLNVAPIGRPETMSEDAYRVREVFVDFDKGSGYRRLLLQRIREALQPWHAAGLRISLGGETSFDIVVEGYDKRRALRCLLAEGCSGVTYVGDALYEGGNDAAILELVREWPADKACPIEVVQVNGWQETLAYLRRMPGR